MYGKFLIISMYTRITYLYNYFWLDLQGGMSSRAVLIIELLDINDNAPETDDTITTEIPRASNISHVIVSQINATDKDSGENGALKFGKILSSLRNTHWH